MLRGSESLKLDGKGRFALPMRMRDAVKAYGGSQMVMTISNSSPADRCLWLFPLPEWEITEKKIADLPTFNRQAQLLKRYVLGNANEVSMDESTGRILIPKILREELRGTNEVMLVGAGNKYEIWPKANWGSGKEDFDNMDWYDNSWLPEDQKDLML